MKILVSTKPIEINFYKPITPNYNGVFISVEDDIEDYGDTLLTENKIKDFLDEHNNFDWDGDIYWFCSQHKDKVLELLIDWFKDPESHTDFEDGIGNLLLIKNTNNGLVIIDTRSDYSTTFLNFIEKLNSLEIDYKNYSDSHLISNIYLGRESNYNEFEILYFLYKEGVIDTSFFLRGTDSLREKYEGTLPDDKTIVITGKLPVPREEITEALKEIEYNVSDKITADSWLWMGDKVGNNKMKKAESVGCKMSTIEEVIDTVYLNYLHKNK